MNVFAKLIQYGAKEFFQYKIFKNIYLFIVIVFNLMGLYASFVNKELTYLFATVFLSSLFSVFFFILFGLVIGILRFPFRLKRDRYRKIFESIRLKSPTDEYPVFLKEKHKEYTNILVFQTPLPLNDWLRKKEHLETRFNAKIVKIVNDENNKNIVEIHFANGDLPSHIHYDKRYDSLYKESVLSVGRGFDEIVKFDFRITPHVFVAGESGSGKSNIVKGLIYQSLIKGHLVILIDFKRGVSYSDFENKLDIYSTHETITKLLDTLVIVTNERYDTFRAHKAEDLDEYNRLNPLHKMPRFVIYIDELAELVKTGSKDDRNSIIDNIESLTRISRGAGVHLVMSTQRPDSTVITGQIKNNVSCRLCGRFVDPEPSRIILNSDIATTLPNVKGRFIIRNDGFTEFQAFDFSSVVKNYSFEFARKTKTEIIGNNSELVTIVSSDKRQQQIEDHQKKPIAKVITPKNKDFEIEFNFDDIEI